MKWLRILLFLIFLSIAFLVFLVLANAALAQTPEIVMTKADIEIRFSGEANWVNGADTAQAIFSVDSIAYSAEALSTNIKHTTKLDTPETWEAEMWHLASEPFKKAVFVITIYQATNRIFELRVRNRFANEGTSGPWSLPTEDKIIGRPGKAANIK